MTVLGLGVVLAVMLIKHYAGRGKRLSYDDSQFGGNPATRNLD